MNEAMIIQRLDRIVTELEEIRGLLVGQKRMTKGTRQRYDQDEIVSAKEVARLLQCNIQAVYSKCTSGELPYMKMGKSYKFKKKDILDWIKQQSPTSSFSVDGYVERYLQKRSLKG